MWVGGEFLMTFAGAWIMSNLRFIHHNEEWWDHPQTFDPSRFLGPEGDVRSSEYLMPFSVG
jgi:cytochrome P450